MDCQNLLLLVTIWKLSQRQNCQKKHLTFVIKRSLFINADVQSNLFISYKFHEWIMKLDIGPIPEIRALNSQWNQGMVLDCKATAAHGTAQKCSNSCQNYVATILNSMHVQTSVASLVYHCGNICSYVTNLGKHRQRWSLKRKILHVISRATGKNNQLASVMYKGLPWTKSVKKRWDYRWSWPEFVIGSWKSLQASDEMNSATNTKQPFKARWKSTLISQYINLGYP